MTDGRGTPGSEEPISSLPDEGESAPETRRAASTRGTRVEMMRAARRERRRRMMGRFWMASAPVLVLVAIAVALLSVYGGQGDEGAVVDTTTATAPTAADGSGLLLIERDGSLGFAVLLQPWDGGGVVLAAPAITLLETQGVFRTLAELYEEGGADVVKAALSGSLDIPLGPGAVVDEHELRAGLLAGGLQALPEEGVVTIGEQAESVALAVRELVSDYSPEGGSPAWEELQLQGDETPEFLQALGLDSVSMAETVWTTSALAGSVVEGDGFSYLEPDIDAARSLLVVTIEQATLSVEVRDGAGVEGAARIAGDLLEAAGFTLAPMSYAEGYPGVETTQVLASPEVMGEAGQVADAIGVGETVEDASLASDRIVVVLGKDFSGGPASTTDGAE